MTSPMWPPAGPPPPNVPAPLPPRPATGGSWGNSAWATPAAPAARVTRWGDAVLFAVASAGLAGIAWWAVVALTKTQFVYGAIGVGVFVGWATATGARRTSIAVGALAAGCTVVSLVVAEYFIQRSIAIDEGFGGIPLWQGFGFAKDVVRLAIEDSVVTALFWALAAVAAGFTAART